MFKMAASIYCSFIVHVGTIDMTNNFHMLESVKKSVTRLNMFFLTLRWQFLV